MSENSKIENSKIENSKIELANVSSNPHVRDEKTTASIMFDVILALMPATVFGVYHFGYRAALLIVITIAACVLTEFLFEKGTKRQITIDDGSAVLTGLLLALNLPYTLPFWMAVLGGMFAILIVKQLFGGLGQNFMNPALGARCFLLISFGGPMTSFALDGVTGATPLAILKYPHENPGISVNLMDMFVGNIRGTIGETSVIALFIGAAYLLIKKIIDIRIPAAYIISFVVFMFAFSGKGMDMTYLAQQVCGGGLILGAFFMATDYVTSPITPKGRVVFGVCLGLLTCLIRLYGDYPEGVSFSIIFCNLLVPVIERFTVPKAFGREGKA